MMQRRNKVQTFAKPNIRLISVLGLMGIAIMILFSVSAHAVMTIDDFKNRKPDVSQPADPPQPTGIPVMLGNLPIACMKTENVVANYTKINYKKKVLGTNATGTFELWTGAYEGKNRWALVVSVNQGLTCMIGGGVVKKTP